jgi:hypothetical protein
VHTWIALFEWHPSQITTLVLTQGKIQKNLSSYSKLKIKIKIEMET